MPTLFSTYQGLGFVGLPSWSGRPKYMHTFDIAKPTMADGYEDYGPVVEALCRAAGYREGQAHMTVDEKIVQAGMSQRRPDAHVDGKYIQSEGRWGHPSPGWAHYCNNVPIDRMSVIVIASVPGCLVYAGTFEGAPKNDGDLEHIRDQLGNGVLLSAHRGFLLSPNCVHESIRFEVPTKRSFLRIALEGGR